MGKRLMTLADLYNYYSSQGTNQTFSCNDDGDTIVVQTDGKLNFSKENPTEGLMPVSLQLCYVGDNLNNSRITKEAMEKALASAKYRPILGYIFTDDDGNAQFSDHRMHIEDESVVYDEVPIGVISEEAYLSYDEDNNKDYAFSKGYIFEEYSKAKEILEREQQCDVSVELSIRSLSYNAEDKILELEDFFFCGVTILGYKEDGSAVLPAMPGSNITLADFSVGNNSVVSQNDLVQVLEKLNTTLSKFEIDNSTRKEELQVENQKVEKPVVDTATDDYIPEEPLVPTDTDEDLSPVMTDEDIPTPTEDTDEPTDEPEAETEDYSVKYSVTVNDTVKEFSVSMNEKIAALSTLVNDTYADDLTYYSVECYDEDKTIVMVDCCNGKAYRQSYKVKDNVFSLKGDRVPVHSMWVTDDEQKAFEDMKSRYAVIDEKLAKYEAEPAKMEIITSSDYAQIAESDDFKAFADQSAHFDMSVDEVKAKCDEMLLDFAKKGTLTFSVESEKKEVGKKTLLNNAKKTSRYGTLFSK